MESSFDKLLLDVAGKLERAGVVHMLTGSFALALYTREFRATNDLDLVVDVRVEHVPALLAMFPVEDGWYISEAAVRDGVAKRRMFNVIQTGSGLKVDLIPLRDEPYEQAKVARRRLLQRAKQGIWVISPEDLLVSKLVWGKAGDSALQLRDARTLVRDYQQMDWDHVRHWAEQLGVSDWLERAR